MTELLEQLVLAAARRVSIWPHPSRAWARATLVAAPDRCFAWPMRERYRAVPE